MSDYKVLIASAGTGSRLKVHTSQRNKGLVTLGTKPAIVHIINKFNHNIPIVMAVGYRKDSLIETIKEFFPDRDITFVNIENFDGVDSGLGHSILQCEHLLECPFIFVPNDTLTPTTDIDLNPSVHGNWIGVFDNSQNKYDPAHYRCAERSNEKVVSILPKGLMTKDIYVGLCGIKDYRQFWSTMKSSAAAISEGESFGINGLDHISVVNVDNWYDTGNLSRLNDAFENYKSPEHNILPKPNEAIWISSHKCIKYHSDQNFISDRLKRLEYMPDDMTPTILSSGKNFFSYEFKEGRLLSHSSDLELFSIFLNKMQKNFWTHRPKYFSKSKEVQENFYRKKTLKRIDEYMSRFDQKDNIDKINGHVIKPARLSLAEFNWNSFYDGAVWAHFHGDLHGENIIATPSFEIFLLDWRQNFGEGNYQFGDVYYDLGKILHGLIVRHSMVNSDRFCVSHNEERSVTLDIDTSLSFVKLQEWFEEWVNKSEYDLIRVKQVTALIFLNIAALHHYPYSKFLFCLGQLLIHEVIRDETA